MICRDYWITNIYWPQRQERCQKPMPGHLGAHGRVESDAKVSALYAYVMQCHLVWLPLRIGAIKDKADLKWFIIYWMHLVPLIFLRMSDDCKSECLQSSVTPLVCVHVCTLSLANKPLLALLAGFNLCWSWRHSAPEQSQTHCLWR